MKKLSLIAAAALLAASSGAFAATETDNFVVSIDFTGSCSVKTGNAATDLSFTYAAFGAADTGSTTTVFECSRGLTPSFSFDNAAGQTSNGLQALGTAITGEGVIAGIRYTMTATPARTQSGTAATAGAGGTGGSDGTADEYTVGVTVDIAGGQAGSGATASGSQTRVLTISY